MGGEPMLAHHVQFAIQAAWRSASDTWASADCIAALSPSGPLETPSARTKVTSARPMNSKTDFRCYLNASFSESSARPGSTVRARTAR